MFQQGMFTIDPDTTPDQLARKRKAIRDMVNRPSARYAGEGLTHLASGILGAIKGRKLDDFEDKKAKEAGDRFNSIFTSPVAAGAPMSGGRTYPAPSPAVTSQPLPGDVADGTMEALIRNGLKDRGFPAHIQDAMIMNMQDESGLNPGINEIAPLVPGSRGGFGLMQWTGPRRRQLEAFAQQRGTSPSDVDTQLDFMMEELRTTEAKAAESIFSAPDAGTAATEIVNKFLRPAEEHRSRRAAQYGGGAQVAQNVGNLQNITEAMSDPWIMQDPGKAAVLQMMLDNAAKLPAQVKPTALQQNVEWLIGQGLPMDQALKAARGGQNINVNTGDAQPTIGTIPQGFSVVEDASEPSGYRMVAIPGGPEDTTQADAATQSARDTASDNVITAAARGREAAKNRNGPTALTSLVGAVNPYSDSAEVMRQVNVLRDITSAEQLNAMRRQSKTGAALGNVTELELGLLARQGGALDPNSPNFLRDLADYERAILRTIHGKEAGDALFEASRAQETSGGISAEDQEYLRSLGIE